MSNYIEDRKNIHEGFNKGLFHDDFETFAMLVFNFQFIYNPTYRQFCELIGRTPRNIKSLREVPFLPIEFFKTQEIKTGEWEAQAIFKSSGTTQQIRSRHFVRDIKHYLENAKKGFEGQFKGIHEYCFIAILPGYVERPDSSLIFMVNEFIKESEYDSSGFYLDQEEEMIKLLKSNKENNVPTILFGVSFALLDLCSISIDFPELLVIETGGMKSSKIDMEKNEIISLFKKAWKIKGVSSEYGMTELLSQSYALDNKWYTPASTKKVFVGKPSGPICYGSSKKNWNSKGG